MRAIPKAVAFVLLTELPFLASVGEDTPNVAELKVPVWEGYSRCPYLLKEEEWKRL